MMVALVHAFSSIYMCGLIWFVQLVHYPLHGAVGPKEFVTYQSLHVRRTSWVVMAPMLAEALTALLLVVYRPQGVPEQWLYVGLGLLFLVWLATAIFSVPAHSTLEKGFSDDAHRRLVATNWIRTFGWSARAPLALLVLVEIASAGGSP